MKKILPIFMVFVISCAAVLIPEDLQPLLGYWITYSEEGWKIDDIYFDRMGSATIEGNSYTVLWGGIIVGSEMSVVIKAAAMLCEDYRKAEQASSKYKYFMITNRCDRYSGDLYGVEEYYFNIASDGRIEGTRVGSSFLNPNGSKWEPFTGERLS